MRTQLNEIAELAADVRYGIVHGALTMHELTQPYLDMFPGQSRAVRAIRRNGLDTFPKGWCGIASAFMRYMLDEGELCNGLLLGRPHTVLDLGSSALSAQTIIVDITGDQMHPGIPPVYVGPLQPPWQASMLEATTPIPDLFPKPALIMPEH
jgi:hypothetical protein